MIPWPRVKPEEQRLDEIRVMEIHLGENESDACTLLETFGFPSIAAGFDGPLEDKDKTQSRINRFLKSGEELEKTLKRLETRREPSPLMTTCRASGEAVASTRGEGIKMNEF